MTDNQEAISSEFPFTLSRVKVYDAEMAYIDTAPKAPPTTSKNPVMLFLHGNPTSYYLSRNKIPYIPSHQTRCLAPDLIGMGASSKLPHSTYHFLDHALYLDEFIALTIPPTQPVILVLHDWGSGLGFHWARRNAHRVAGLAFMEFVAPMTWEGIEGVEGESLLRVIRGPEEAARKLIIEENFFVEKFLPAGVARGLTEAEMTHYRRPYLLEGQQQQQQQPASSDGSNTTTTTSSSGRSSSIREPLYRWPNEVPISGKPEHIAAIVSAYHTWLLDSELPKLLFHATPGAAIRETQVRKYRAVLKNARIVDVGAGIHWIQEDNPHLIGRELAEWMERVIIGEEGKGGL